MEGKKGEGKRRGVVVEGKKGEGKRRRGSSDVKGKTMRGRGMGSGGGEVVEGKKE